MADDQDTYAEEDNAPAYFDSSTVVGPLVDDTVTVSTAVPEDYVDDDSLPDVMVNLIINDLPGDSNTLPADLVNAGVTDWYGNSITPPTTLIDSINDYASTVTQELYTEMIGNETNIGSKGWFGKFNDNLARDT
jgi:hypothetical protein